MKATSVTQVENSAKLDKAFLEDLARTMAQRCALLAGMHPGDAIRTEVYWREDKDVPPGASLYCVSVIFPDPINLTEGEHA